MFTKVSNNGKYIIYTPKRAIYVQIPHERQFRSSSPATQGILKHDACDGIPLLRSSITSTVRHRPSDIVRNSFEKLLKDITAMTTMAAVAPQPPPRTTTSKPNTKPSQPPPPRPSAPPPKNGRHHTLPTRTTTAPSTNQKKKNLTSAKELIRSLDIAFADMTSSAASASEDAEDARRNARAASEVARRYTGRSYTGDVTSRYRSSPGSGKGGATPWKE
eukprot:4138308-Ditylum_brightwellii.AAC.1